MIIYSSFQKSHRLAITSYTISYFYLFFSIRNIHWKQQWFPMEFEKGIFIMVINCLSVIIALATVSKYRQLKTISHRVSNHFNLKTYTYNNFQITKITEVSSTLFDTKCIAHFYVEQNYPHYNISLPINLRPLLTASSVLSRFSRKVVPVPLCYGVGQHLLSITWRLGGDRGAVRRKEGRGQGVTWRNYYLVRLSLSIHLTSHLWYVVTALWIETVNFAILFAICAVVR